MSKTPIRSNICLAIKEPIINDYLYDYLVNKSGIDSVTQCYHKSELSTFAAKQGHKVLLLDVLLPGITSALEVPDICKQCNADNTLLVCDDTKPEDAQLLLSLNFKNIIRKNAKRDTFKYGVNNILRNIPFNDDLVPDALQQKLEQLQSACEQIGEGIHFTPRETTIANLYRQGYKADATAQKLGIKKITLVTNLKAMSKKVKGCGYKNLKEYLKAKI